MLELSRLFEIAAHDSNQIVGERTNGGRPAVSRSSRCSVDVMYAPAFIAARIAEPGEQLGWSADPLQPDMVRRSSRRSSAVQALRKALLSRLQPRRWYAIGSAAAPLSAQ